MEILKVEHLEKTYTVDGNKIKAVDNVSFSMKQGEFVAITGSSGSGKSTLLHIIGGVDVISGGSVYIQGENLHALKNDKLTFFRRKHISIIYQFYNLLPVLNVRENILLPLKLDHQAIDEDKLSFFLHLLNLNDRTSHLPSQLSGGQQQRVAIARSLMSNPSIILADEPTGNLDKKNSEEIINYFCEIHKNNHQTILMVTHDINIAEKADRIIVLEDGKIIKEISK